MKTIQYDVRGPHFTIFPTDDIRYLAVWKNKDSGNGHEAFVGTIHQCYKFIRDNPLPVFDGGKVAK